MYRTIVARLPDYALQRRVMPHIGTSMAAPLEIDSTARIARTHIATPEQARPIAPQQAQTATFLRLAIVPNSPIANCGIKTQAIGRTAAYYHPAATKKSP